jgi:hypothetical protein
VAVRDKYIKPVILIKSSWAISLANSKQIDMADSLWKVLLKLIAMKTSGHTSNYFL